VLDADGKIIRESGTSRGAQHVPSLEALRQQHGEFPVEVQHLLSEDPETKSDAIGRLVDVYFRDRHPSERAAILSDINLIGGEPRSAPQIAPRRRRSYVSPAGLPSAASRDPFEVDPDVVDRGNRAHVVTLNALASFLRQKGIEPLCPDPDEPAFDLAWELDGLLFVAEVKSVTPSNEEKQLRLGLGQVLRYRQTLQATEGRSVIAVLVPERASTAGWLELCQALNVKLVWPGTFEEL
jgi:hypothetical protein